MKQLINVAKFMSIFSIITLGSTVAELIVYLILAGVIWLLSNYCHQLVTRINAVHEFTLTHQERHKGLEQEIHRIDRDVQHISGDLKKQIEELDAKLDKFMNEIRKDRST